MRVGHFESLKPVCPRCNIERQIIAPLNIANVAQKTDDIIIEGNLVCSNPQCQIEYPIIDGIPLIVNNLRKYINDNFYRITVRDDLNPLNESLLGDFSGPGSEFNSIRHYASTYVWDHYGDKAPVNEFETQSNNCVPGSVVNCLQAGIALFETSVKGPALDIGCAVGRSTFETAKNCGGLALGIDLNFSLLRIAQKILRDGHVSFPLKRTGVVYDQHEYDIDFENVADVDFWACDACALPFTSKSFSFISALNVLDAVNSPAIFLQSLSHALADNGNLLLSTPYDWSPPVPIQNWLGGHSQRHSHQGSSESVLRKHLSSDQNTHLNLKLVMTGEIEHHPWILRVHSRRTVHYDAHIIACKKAAD